MATYSQAGVDLEAADQLVAAIGPAVTATWHGGIVGGFGGFAAGLTLPAGYRNPVLMMSTDGVGTKVDVARRAGMLDGLGFDLVAMCVDDLAAAGARPIAMMDYIAVGHLDVAAVAAIVRSVAAACESVGVALVGGETAEHPGVMEEDALDIAGTALGIVELGAEIDGSRIVAGDVLVGIDSPNFRSNGFSLLRSALAGLELTSELPGTGRSVASVLLEPSVVYAPVVLDVIGAVDAHGLAHVTGGGIAGNLERVLPSSVDASVDTASWQRPEAFDVVARLGGIDHSEMFRTFNMGIGYVLAVRPAFAQAVIGHFRRRRLDALTIGKIRKGKRDVELK